MSRNTNVKAITVNQDILTGLQKLWSKHYPNEALVFNKVIRLCIIESLIANKIFIKNDEDIYKSWLTGEEILKRKLQDLAKELKATETMNIAKIIFATLSEPKTQGLITAANRKNLLILLSNLQEECKKQGLSFSHNERNRTIKINETTHYVHTADKCDYSRGVQAGWHVMDSVYDDIATNCFASRVRK